MRNSQIQKEITGYKTVPALLFLLAAFLVSHFFVQIALIQGESMEPSYHHLQFVLLDKLPRKYVSGDVIVFRKDGIKGVLIKRIAACPGDRLQIIDGILTVNGEPQTAPMRIRNPGNAQDEIVLDEGQYFVLGDNLNHSIDSRLDEVGNVSADDILGCVIFPVAHNPFST